MKVDLTKKEIAAIGELIYSVLEDKATLSFPEDWSGPACAATLSKKGERWLRTAWNALAETGAFGAAEWDEVFTLVENCEKCGK